VASGIPADCTNVPRPGNVTDPVYTATTSTRIPNAPPLPHILAYQPCDLFQDRVNWKTGCGWPDTPAAAVSANYLLGGGTYFRPHVAQNPHSGGMNVTLGDGSVRNVSRGVSATTWARACDPRDGDGGVGLGSD